MQNKIQGILLLTLFSMLTACHTMSSNTKPPETKQTKSAILNTQLGITYLQHQQVQLAKQKLLLALQEDPNIPETWYAMAFYLEVTGDNTQANQYYLKALALAPKNGEAHNNYGTYLCRTGNYQAAISQFMVAVQDSDYLDTASAYENAGLCSLKIPNRKMAANYFKQALGHDPNLPTSLIELTQFEYDQKNYASAKEHLREFLTIAPPTEQSRFLSAELGEKLGYLHGLKKTPDMANSSGEIRWS
ncbi:MAG: type IV pilus biogenesis/stability protein PilW [Pseudomonadota bacterium]